MKITKTFNKLLDHERGASAIEYGLLAALVGTAFMMGAVSLGDSIGEVTDYSRGEVDEVISAMSGTDPDSGNDDNTGASDGNNDRGDGDDDDDDDDDDD